MFCYMRTIHPYETQINKNGVHKHRIGSSDSHNKVATQVQSYECWDTFGIENRAGLIRSPALWNRDSRTVLPHETKADRILLVCSLDSTEPDACPNFSHRSRTSSAKKEAELHFSTPHVGEGWPSILEKREPQKGLCATTRRRRYVRELRKEMLSYGNG